MGNFSGKGDCCSGQLSQRKRSLSLEKARLEKRIKDIDKYILEYTSGIKEETEFEKSMQKINTNMKMVTQLATGRKELENSQRMSAGLGGGDKRNYEAPGGTTKI